jgi:hypothetical protein
MSISCPLTWGSSSVERRDLMVATYSLLCATGDIVTVTVCTGRACGPPPPGAAASGFFWQPLAANPARITQLIVEMRCNLLCVNFFVPWLK